MLAMKLVNCHHIRKRRRRRRRWAQQRPASARTKRAPLVCAMKKENLLNNSVNEVGATSAAAASAAAANLHCDTTTSDDQDDCDQAQATRAPAYQVSKSQVPPSRPRPRPRPASSSSYLFYLALVCLVVSNDDWLHSSDQRRATVARADSDANRLYEDLMMTYNRIVRPVQNESDRVVVRMGLKLSQLMEVNLKNQMMTINVWLNQEWSDYKLKWDPSEYGGIEDINLPAEQIWLPDIALYNSAEGTFTVSIMTKARVRFDGYVIWNPPAIFRSSCQIDITYFPFDSQNCHLKFGSWTFGTKLDLRHINDTDGTIERGTDLSEYYQNVEWDIMQASARRNVIVYDCCPNDIYPDVTFNFTLRRKPLFYTVNLILPCVGITFFSFLVFYLPSDSGEKVTLTISILVSLIFFLSVLIETIPSTSLAMPLLGKYLVFTMILITLSVCATVCVLNIHFRTPSTHSMPLWIKHWCMDVLPKYLFMSVPQYQSQQANILPEHLIYAHNPAYGGQANASSSQQQQGAHFACFNSSAQANNLLLMGQLELNVADFFSGGAGNQEQREPAAAADLARPSSDVSRSRKLAGSGQQNWCSSSNNLNSNTAQNGDTNNSGRLHELNAAELVAGAGAGVFQARPSSILPYLHSEAARRLQMQRSRSSERENRSASDNQQASGSNGSRGTSEQRSNREPPSRQKQSQPQPQPQPQTQQPTPQQEPARDGQRNESLGSRGSSETRRKAAEKKRKSSLLWSLFGMSRGGGRVDDRETRQSAPAPPSINAPSRRKSRASASSSVSGASRNDEAAVAANEDDDDHHQDDDYQHHRHFQARASICSNNLWRIGPTRRCSLAVPANYPTYYRPLAQLHPPQSSQQGPATISECLQRRAGHYHTHTHTHSHAPDAASQQSSLSTDTSNYRSGTTVGTLIQAAASNLLRPKQMPSAVLSGVRREEREMSPLTSGGFIRTPGQGSSGLGAMPPRRQLETPSSFRWDSQSQSQSQSNMPTPPPPPPLPPDFGDSLSSSSTQQHSFETISFQPATLLLNQAQQSGAPNARQQSSLGAQYQVRGQPRAAPNLFGYSLHRDQTFTGDTAASSFAQAPSLGRFLAADHTQQQLSMPRSRSTDQRLSSLLVRGEPSINGALSYQQTNESISRHNNNNNNNAALIRAAQQHQQQAPLYQLSQAAPTATRLAHRQQGFHSIGRQLGQAYIQKLQRQPTVYSLRSGLPAAAQMAPLMRTGLGQQLARLPAGQQSLFQAHFEPSIDMLRRSRSQTSLNRRAAPATNGPFQQQQQQQQQQLAVDCQHCLRASQRVGANETDANLQARPLSDMRGRFNSTGCRYGSTANFCAGQKCDDGLHCGPSFNPDAGPRLGSRLLVGQEARAPSHNNCDELACRCRALTQQHQKRALGVSREPSAQPSSSSLSMLKLIGEVDKAIQNAMFIAQHIDNLDEFESVKENWKYIAMVIDRIFLIIFLFACIVGTVAIFALVPWSYYLNEKPIDLQLTKLLALNLTSSEMLASGCRDFR